MFLKEETKEEYIKVRMTSTSKKKLKRLAEIEGLNLSKFVLKCIDYYIKNGGK